MDYCYIEMQIKRKASHVEEIEMLVGAHEQLEINEKIDY